MLCVHISSTVSSTVIGHAQDNSSDKVIQSRVIPLWQTQLSECDARHRALGLRATQLDAHHHRQSVRKIWKRWFNARKVHMFNIFVCLLFCMFRLRRRHLDLSFWDRESIFHSHPQLLLVWVSQGLSLSRNPRPAPLESFLSVPGSYNSIRYRIDLCWSSRRIDHYFGQIWREWFFVSPWASR